MENQNFLDGRKIFAQIKEKSNANRASPLECFCEFLQHIWMDNSEQEALRQWKVKVEHFPWYADDALHCMDVVITNPPENLVELIEEYGWIILTHEPDESGDEAPYTYEEYLEWLKQMRDKFKAVYDAVPSELSEDN
jgi:hypothetical protein